MARHEQDVADSTGLITGREALFDEALHGVYDTNGLLPSDQREITWLVQLYLNQVCVFHLSLPRPPMLFLPFVRPFSRPRPDELAVPALHSLAVLTEG